MKVHVVSWEHQPDGGGFNWYRTCEIANKMFRSECETYSDFEVKTTVFLFDCEVAGGTDEQVTEQVDEYLQGCDATPPKPIRVSIVGGKSKQNQG